MQAKNGCHPGRKMFFIQGYYFYIYKQQGILSPVAFLFYIHHTSVMKRIVLFLLVIFSACSHLQAQYYSDQNKIWTFGNHAGLNFSTGAPVAMPSTLGTQEGCATMCDTDGHLMFYTNGRVIYNKLGTVMPAGSTIVPFATNSTSQATVIAPVLSNPNRYYVFSMQEITGTACCSLAYCIVDMTLAGGLGDVVPATNVQMATLMGEKLIAISGYNCDIWIVTHRKDSAKFFAYEITSAGVSTTPVISAVGTFTGMESYSAGVIKPSHDGKLIVAQCGGAGAHNGSELYDFDPNTGIVSNCRVLDSSSFNYGAEFSPDNSKLYVNLAIGGANRIAQYDLSLSTTAAIVASRTVVAGGTGFATDLKLGPDGKVYFNSLNSISYLGVIDSPDEAGLACHPIPNVVSVSPNTCAVGLPNSYAIPGTTPIVGTTPICTGTTTTWTNSSTGGIWTSSNPAVATISTTGVITAVSQGTSIITFAMTASCGIVRTTKLLKVIAAPHAGIITGADTVCPGHTIRLYDTVAGGVWTSLDTTIAKINDTGLVSAILTGLDTILYVVTNACGSDTERYTIYVSPASQFCGTGISHLGDPLKVLNVYPNPNKGTFVVSVAEDARVTITNLLGEQIMQVTVQANSPAQLLLDAPSGMYFLTAVTDSGTWSERVSIAR